MMLLPLVLFVMGLLVLVVGAEVLVRGASRLAAGARIPPLVIGLTVVAFGTSAPELAVSVQAAIVGRGALALGNVVGSNIFNVLAVLGLSALAAPLVVSMRIVRLDVPIMIATSGVVWVMTLNGRVGRLEGVLLVSALIVYTVWTVRQAQKEPTARSERPEPGGPASTLVGSAGLVALGLALLVLGAGWLVDGATAMAHAAGVSELIVGLTVVAAGTSLPEAATSIVASVRGERDMAVGNVVGSNLFNLLGVLGVAAVVGGIDVPRGAAAFDLPVMTAVAIACLPIFFTGRKISRGEGAVFVGYYVAYSLFLFLDATRHDMLPLFNGVMLIFVIPLTVVTLGMFAIREVRSRG